METFNDAVEIIETATTLGMHVSAPLGVTAYAANIYMQDDSGSYTAEMGTYATKVRCSAPGFSPEVKHRPVYLSALPVSHS